jgi:hypothetical protein
MGLGSIGGSSDPGRIPGTIQSDPGRARKRCFEINRYIHLNPVRVKALGGHEARPGAEDRLRAAGTAQAANWLKPALRLSVATLGVLTKSTLARLATQVG